MAGTEDVRMQGLVATITWTQDWTDHLTQAYGVGSGVKVASATASCPTAGVTITATPSVDGTGYKVTFVITTDLAQAQWIYPVIVGHLSNGDVDPRTYPIEVAQTT